MFKVKKIFAIEVRNRKPDTRNKELWVTTNQPTNNFLFSSIILNHWPWYFILNLNASYLQSIFFDSRTLNHTGMVYGWSGIVNWKNLQMGNSIPGLLCKLMNAIRNGDSKSYVCSCRLELTTNHNSTRACQLFGIPKGSPAQSRNFNIWYMWSVVCLALRTSFTAWLDDVQIRLLALGNRIIEFDRVCLLSNVSCDFICLEVSVPS